MNPQTAVKTEEKAIKILEEWLNEQINPDHLSSDTYIDHIVGRCECGETQALKAWIEGNTKIAHITICETCGDDDAFINEVLYF